MINAFLLLNIPALSALDNGPFYCFLIFPTCIFSLKVSRKALVCSFISSSSLHKSLCPKYTFEICFVPGNYSIIFSVSVSSFTPRIFVVNCYGHQISSFVVDYYDHPLLFLLSSESVVYHFSS